MARPPIGRLIYIGFQPRSGSSMTAGILSLHGVWTGQCRIGNPDNPKGFFENERFGRYLRKIPKPKVPNTWHYPPPNFHDEFRQLLFQQGYEGEQPWLVKNSIMALPMFESFGPFVVCPIRSVDAIFKSCRRSGIRGNGMTDEELELEILSLRKLIDIAVQEGATPIDTDGVARGDYTTIKRFIEDRLGVEFNKRAVDQFVDRRYWRH